MKKHDDYEAFVRKFDPAHKFTTDDCMTPQPIYDAAAERKRVADECVNTAHARKTIKWTLSDRESEIIKKLSR